MTFLSQEKKAEEDLPALKTTLTHQYNDLKKTFKKSVGGRLITAIWNNTDQDQ